MQDSRKLQYFEDAFIDLVGTFSDLIDEHFEVNAIFSRGKVLNYVSDEFLPEEVFDVDTLEKWAEFHGYVKEG